MVRTIDVAFRFEDVEVGNDYGAAAVIDTLRATTTMIALMERGVLAIRPVASLDEAYALQQKDPQLLLGGERNNRPPEGFDGGNSPYDWPKERVYQRRVVYTTTNGTAAIDRARTVPRLILAALTNAEAAFRYLWSLERPVLVVASGTRGQVALEDVLAAGAIAARWPREGRTDRAEMAAALFLQNQGDIGRAVRESRHGRDLAEMGLDRDLDYAAQLNMSRVVPVLSQDGWIRAVD